MITNAQNTNFGKINIVVSRRSFDAKPVPLLGAVGKIVKNPWTPAQTIFSKDEAVTKGIKVCTAGILKAKDGDEFALLHLSPFTNSVDQVKKHLKELYERFKDTGVENLEGFLFGADAENGCSMERANYIHGFFKRKKIDFAALIGQKFPPSADLYFSLPKNEATVTFHDCEKVKQPKELGKSFQKIVSGSHTIEFRGD